MEVKGLRFQGIGFQVWSLVLRLRGLGFRFRGSGLASSAWGLELSEPDSLQNGLSVPLECFLRLNNAPQFEVFLFSGKDGGLVVLTNANPL